MLRSVHAVCASAMIATMAGAASAQGPGRCEETSFRIYFAHGSAALDPMAIEAMDLAERRVAGCSYAALRVMVDGSSSHISGRAAAIRAAADGRAWDDVRIERRAPLRPDRNGPEFAEVVMTPNALPSLPPDSDNDVGV